MAQPLPAGMSKALCRKCSARSSKVHVAAMSCVQITGLLYCVKDNILPKELLLAFDKGNAYIIKYSSASKKRYVTSVD